MPDAVSFTLTGSADAACGEVVDFATVANGRLSPPIMPPAPRPTVLVERVQQKPTGATPISGTIRYSLGPNVAVSFTLDSDQSYLGAVLEALNAVTQQFPTRS